MISKEEVMWRLFLGLSAIPGAMVLVACKRLPESLRYLSVVGSHGGAVKVSGWVGVVFEWIFQFPAALTTWVHV